MNIFTKIQSLIKIICAMRYVGPWRAMQMAAWTSTVDYVDVSPTFHWEEIADGKPYLTEQPVEVLEIKQKQIPLLPAPEEP